MPNELLLILSFILIYGGVVLFYRVFGKDGLITYNVFATVIANIEVLLVIKAFGMEMTLGNVLFGSTFLITDILSENHSKKDADKAVLMGTCASLLFILISQLWLAYSPSENCFTSDAFRTIFSHTPRIVLASLAVYVITQLGDVWLYHKWWDWCKRHFSDSRKGLWIRNNGSTLISQLANTVLYTLLAFYGTYDWGTLLSIGASTYAIYFIISLLDTPLIYLCRYMHEKGGRRSGTE